MRTGNLPVAILFCLIPFCLRTSGQMFDYYWVKKVSSKTSFWLKGEMKYDGSAGFRIVADGTDFSGIDYDEVAYIDTAGNVGWVKQYNLNKTYTDGMFKVQKVFDRKPDETLNIIRSQGRIALFKVSENGDSLSNTIIPTTQFGSENLLGKFPVLTSNGSIIFDIKCIADDSRLSHCGIVEVSSSGSVLWEYRNDSISNYQLAIVENGNYISVATPIPEYPSSAFTVMTKRTSDHQTLWKKNVARGRPMELYTKFNGLYALVSIVPDTMFFALIDQNGNTIKNWALKTANGQPNLLINAPCVIDTILPDTSVHLTGIYMFTVYPMIFERHIDATGHYIVPPCTTGFSDDTYLLDFFRVKETVYGITEQCELYKMGINNPPRLTGPWHDSLIDVLEDSIFSETVMVIDTFPGERITLKLLSGTEGGVSFMPSTGTITCSPTTEADSGNHVVSIQATDRLKQADTLRFTIHVTPVNDAPEVSNLSLRGQVYEDDTAEVTVSISDEENDPLAIVWTRNERDTIRSGTDVLRYVPGLPCGRTDSISLVVSDGISTVKRSCRVPVLHRAIPPVIENPDNSPVTSDSLIRWSFTGGIDHKLDTTAHLFYLAITQNNNNHFTNLSKDSINTFAVRLNEIPEFGSLSDGLIDCKVRAFDAYGYSTPFSSVKTFIYHTGMLKSDFGRVKNNPNRFFIGKINKTIFIVLPESDVPSQQILFTCYDLRGRVLFVIRMESYVGMKKAIEVRCAMLPSGIHIFKYQNKESRYYCKALF